MNRPTSYKCDKCSKSFSRKDYLTRHEFNHNKIKPFRCNICNFSFTRSDLLAKHCKTKSHLNRIVTKGGIIKLSRDTAAASVPNSQHFQRRSMSLSEIMEKNSFIQKNTSAMVSAPEFSSSAPLERIITDKNDINSAIECDDEVYSNTETKIQPTHGSGKSTSHYGILSTSNLAVLPPLSVHLSSIFRQSQSLTGTSGIISTKSSSSNIIQGSMRYAPEDNRHKMRISSVLNYD